MTGAVEMACEALVVSPASLLEELEGYMKAERKKAALVKIASDRKIIANLKYENGQDPLALFPREVWEEIFSYLDNPSDLKNVLDTCPIFKNILEGRSVQDILMPLALEVEELRISLQRERLSPHMSSFFSEIFIEKESEFVKLRSVCKSWRNAFDQSVENCLEKLRFSQDESGCCLSKHKFQCPLINQECFHSLTSALIKFNPDKETNAKRLITKAMVVEIVNLRNPEMLIRKVNEFDFHFSRLLEYIGEQILDFELHSLTPYLPGTALYRLLEKWVGLMPNLKYLKIEENTRNDIVLQPQERSFNSFHNALREGRINHFPNLKNLKGVEILIGRTTKLSDILEMILLHNRQIEKLTVLGNRFYPNDEITELISHLHLTSLSIDNSALLTLPLMRGDMGNSIIQWKLEDVHLQFSDNFSPAGVNMAQVFSFLQKFENLGRIQLILNEVKVKGAQDVSLFLPKLKHFRFRHRQQNDGIPPPLLIFTFSATPFLLKENPKKLVWTVNQDLISDVSGGFTFTDVSVEPGELSVKYKTHEEVWSFFDLFDWNNIRVMKHTDGVVPTVRITRMRWWADDDDDDDKTLKSKVMAVFRKLGGWKETATNFLGRMRR